MLGRGGLGGGGPRCGGKTHVASGWRRAQAYTLAANKLSATGLWDEAKECYAGALQSFVGSASRHNVTRCVLALDAMVLQGERLTPSL
jgi:hypothetical protein